MTTDTNQLVNTAQEAAIIDVKETLASKQDVLMAIGQIQAFNNIRKYVTVTEIITFKKIKESKQYKGLVYKNENGESVTVTDLKDVCEVFFGRSYEAMSLDLNNLESFGAEFLESSQNMGLGYRDLRKLRQLPEESQQLIINSEAVELGDKDAIKELIEDIVLKQESEKSELKKQVEEANQTVKAIRANSDEKQKQLDDIKELEAKRRFSQEPWKHQTLELSSGMIEAKLKVEEGINQMLAIFDAVKDPDSTLDEKSIQLCGRSLMTEAIGIRDRSAFLLNEVAGIFGGIFEPDMTADDAYLEANDIEPLQE